MKSIMSRYFSSTCVMVSLALIWATTAGAAVDAPAGTRIEAESSPPQSTSSVIGVTDASGGKMVSSKKAWEPVFSHAIDPTALPKRVKVYVRHRGGPIQLKAQVNGKQKALDWVWSKPNDLAWDVFGTYDRAELGKGIVIIRGKGDAAVDIDAVVLGAAGGAAVDTPRNAADAGVQGVDGHGGGALPPARPRAGLAVRETKVSVRWNQVIGRITARHWGVAAYQMGSPEAADDASFTDYLDALKPGIVRVHRADMMDKWSNAKTHHWDAQAIRRSLSPMAGLPKGTGLMVCFTDWPKWFSEHKVLPADKVDAAAGLVSDFVRTVVKASPVPVTHIELFNEFDNAYEKAGRLDELWTLFHRVAQAAHAAAPGVKIGGPALTWPKPAWVDGFLDANADVTDFITWHNYATGDSATPNAKLFDAAGTVQKNAQYVTNQLNKRGLNKVETYLTEFSIKWVWKPYEPRVANNVGAVYLGSVVDRMARLGISGATVWQTQGDAYGLIDDAGQMRATGQLYLLARAYAVGQLVASEPAVGDLLEVVPVISKHARVVLLLNKGESPVDVGKAGDLLGVDGPFREARIDADGLTLGSLKTDQPLVLPGWSATFVHDGAGPPGLNGTYSLPGQNRRFDF